MGSDLETQVPAVNQMIEEGVAAEHYAEIHAGWVSVLMNLKAVADFGCDLRNHDPQRTWQQGYLNN